MWANKASSYFPLAVRCTLKSVFKTSKITFATKYNSRLESRSCHSKRPVSIHTPDNASSKQKNSSRRKTSVQKSRNRTKKPKTSFPLLSGLRGRKTSRKHERWLDKSRLTVTITWTRFGSASTLKTMLRSKPCLATEMHRISQLTKDAWSKSKQLDLITSKSLAGLKIQVIRSTSFLVTSLVAHFLKRRLILWEHWGRSFWRPKQISISPDWSMNICRLSDRGNLGPICWSTCCCHLRSLFWVFLTV